MSTILRPFARTGLMLSPVTLGCSPRAGRSGGRCLANPARPDSRCRPASRDNATLNHRNHRCGNLRRRASHASRRTRSRADEQPEVAQPRCDLLRGERAHPGGGQLERQRRARQIRSTGPTVASSTPNYPPQHPRWSEAKYLGWSR
jgi:hypothetical protein